MAVFPLADWNVTVIRLTAFPVTPERRTDLRWWSQTTGVEPESRATKATPARLEEWGPFDAGVSRLSVVVTPIRTDWVLTGEPTPTPWPDAVGNLPEVCPRFLALMQRWLKLPDRFPIQRLALGMVLNHREETREAGYERISRFLANTLQVDAARTTELSFQVNWPASSDVVENLKINRLSKWAVLALRAVAIGPGGPTRQPIEEGWSSTLELDINTDAEREVPLPEGGLPHVLDELVEHARRLASDGDAAK